MGLMDYHARFYSPSLGRFTQPDSIIPNAGNPQSWNRFSYVLNSPINFNDPTGHMCSDPDDQWGNGCDGSGTPPPTTPLPNSGGGNPGGNSSGNGNGNSGNNNDMKTSDMGEDFIKYWEDSVYPHLYPYSDMGGNCTIGWGHLLPNDGNGCSGWPNKTYGNGIKLHKSHRCCLTLISKFLKNLLMTPLQ